jgi:hypothetical protein
MRIRTQHFRTNPDTFTDSDPDPGTGTLKYLMTNIVQKRLTTWIQIRIPIADMDPAEPKSVRSYADPDPKNCLPGST